MDFISRVETARPEDHGPIKKLLRDSDLILEGVDDTEFWVVRDDPGVKLKACVGLEIRGNNGLLRSLAVTKEF